MFSVIGLVGCSGPETAASSTNTPPAPTNAAMPSNKRSNTPDVNIYPAPPGVKTGIEGGKKD